MNGNNRTIPVTIYIPPADLEQVIELSRERDWIVTEPANMARTKVQMELLMNNLYNYTEQHAVLAAKNMTMLPIDELIVELDDLQLHRQSHMFNSGQGVCLVPEQNPLELFICEHRILTHRDLGIDISDQPDYRSALILFLKKVNELQIEGRVLHIPGVEYCTWMTDSKKSDFLNMANPYLSDAERYMYFGGLVFCDAEGDMCMPSVCATSEGYDWKIQPLRVTVLDPGDVFFVLEHNVS